MSERVRRLNIRITDDEWQMARKLADVKGMTASDIVRMLLRDLYFQTFPTKPKR